MRREEVSEKLPAELNRPFSHQRLTKVILNSFLFPQCMALWHVCVYRPNRQMKNLQNSCFVLVGTCFLVLSGLPRPSHPAGRAPSEVLWWTWAIQALWKLSSQRLWFYVHALRCSRSLCLSLFCASLGMCVSGNLHKFLHHFFFFPTNLPGSGVRSYGDDIPVTPHIDHIENMCLFILGLLSPVSAVSQHLCFPGVWPVTEGYRITVVKSSDFCLLCLGSNPDSSTFCLCNSEQSVFPFCKNECAVDSNNCM